MTLTKLKGNLGGREFTTDTGIDGNACEETTKDQRWVGFSIESTKKKGKTSEKKSEQKKNTQVPPVLNPPDTRATSHAHTLTLFHDPPYYLVFLHHPHPGPLKISQIFDQHFILGVCTSVPPRLPLNRYYTAEFTIHIPVSSSLFLRSIIFLPRRQKRTNSFKSFRSRSQSW